MKNYWILLLAVCVALFSCGKETPAPEPIPTSLISFQLTADFPTKAVKTGWEEGDVIFVFFSEQESPAYLEMKYSNNIWEYTPKNGLALSNGDHGRMRAVYLPFGSGTSVREGENYEYEFTTTYDSYYLTDIMDYTVANNTVSGSFKMSVPGNYVQFFVEDNTATDGAYLLATDAVTPVDILSVSEDVETVDTYVKPAGADLTGYAYDNGKDPKGYLFSGVLVSGYTTDYGGNYYFAKTKVLDGSRCDYFVSGKTALASRDSRKLPSSSASGWIPVGASKTVSLSKTVSGTTKKYGTWYTCNEGATAPNEVGLIKSFDEAVALSGTNKLLPAYDFMNSVREQLTWIPMSVYRTPGWVVSDGKAFLFFPLSSSTNKGWYWTRTAAQNDKAYHLYLVHKGDRSLGDSPTSMQYYARYLYSTQ